jgi:lysophospholipase L1-like esterase
MFTNAKIIGNLSFVDDGNLAFTIEHNWHDASHYSVGRYVLTTAGSALHKLGLLGLGDSFISGEGAFNYVDDTDTTLNKCHLSRSSYPYILGRGVADSYESVACSGATTDDIINSNDKYDGQTTKKFQQGTLDQDAILAALTPGFLNQNKFTQKYLPSSILLSVGGNDIGFADLVKKCVTNPDNDAPCYGSYEDRLELATLIASKYTALYKTYQQIMDASPGVRLYVVGYPEIVKPYGDCGENVHLNPAETEFAQQIVTYLNDVIEQAAKKAGAFYVDDHSALYGERLCEGSGDFIAVNGLTAGMDDGLPLFGKKKLYFLGHESYHPNAHGYELMATKIASKTLGLSSPMLAANPELTMPMPDDSNPLLQGMPHTGRKVYTLVPDPQMAADVLLKSQSANVTVDGLQANTQPGGTYNAVLHSDPIDLGTVKADASGNINADVTIPNDVAPGFHTLHLYGKSFDGEDIDIQKEVYVAASPEDYDGDGIANGQEKCVLAEPSNQDYDEDGIDDACDPEITEPPVLVATTTSDPTSPQKAVSVATTTQTASTAQLPTATVNSPVAADTMPATVAKLAKPNVLGIMTAKPQATVPTRISASDITSISNGKLLVASMLLLGIIAAIVAIVRRRV